MLQDPTQQPMLFVWCIKMHLNKTKLCQNKTRPLLQQTATVSISLQCTFCIESVVGWWTGFCTAGVLSAILLTWLGHVCPSSILPHLASSMQLVSLGSCPVLFTGLWEAGGEEGRPLSWARVATCIPHSCQRKWMPERGTPAAKRKGFTEALQMILHSCKNSPLEFQTDFCYKTKINHSIQWFFWGAGVHIDSN